jgi:hypothetical protein
MSIKSRSRDSSILSAMAGLITIEVHCEAYTTAACKRLSDWLISFGWERHSDWSVNHFVFRISNFRFRMSLLGFRRSRSTDTGHNSPGLFLNQLYRGFTCISKIIFLSTDLGSTSIYIISMNKLLVILPTCTINSKKKLSESRSNSGI